MVTIHPIETIIASYLYRGLPGFAALAYYYQHKAELDARMQAEFEA
jgi:hypothetical protein